MNQTTGWTTDDHRIQRVETGQIKSVTLPRFSLLPTIWPLCVALGVALWLGGCGKGAESTAPSAQPPPPKVKVAKPLSQEVVEWDEYTGRIEAVDSVDVKARVSGYLEKINFSAGDQVTRGELLFQIDPRPYQAQLNLANAKLEQAKTRSELARNDLQRANQLLKAKAISEEEHDKRNKGLREAAAAVQSAKAEVEIAQLNLDYTQVVSPINGHVGREQVTVGNLVSGGDNATLLTTIVSSDPVYVYFDADERSVLKYRRQQSKHADIHKIPAKLAVADESDFPHQGYLDYQSPQADPATGTVRLRGVFANPDELLIPGFFARVRIRAAAPYPALLIPDRAILTDQAQRFVWILNAENQAEHRRVTPGALVGTLRVIQDGVQADDRIVIEGVQKVRPGAQVVPEPVTLNESE